MTLFVDLCPNVMISSTNPAYSLTANNAASTPYTLKVMSVIALVLLPVVLAYQGWTYYVFRKRVTVHHFRPGAEPSMAPAAAEPATPAAAEPAAATPAATTPAGSRRGRHRHWPGGRG